MEHKTILLTEDPKNLFFKYLGATVFANLTHALYVLVDLLCVGLGVGSEALAAMNIALPIFTVFTAISLCIGVGGATTMSLMIGKGREDQCREIFTLASGVVIVQGILIGIVGTVWIEPIARLLGADDTLLPMVKEYLVPVNLFSVVYMYSHMLQCFLRNDGNPKLAMHASIIGSILNIVFDVILIFVFKMGIVGAALPSALSPIVVIIIMLFHFKRPGIKLGITKKFFNMKQLITIIKNGLGVFLLEIMAGVSIFILNITLMKDYGMMSVATYSIMANMVYVGKSVYNGVAQAAQPIISINEGAGKYHRSHLVTKVALWTSLIIGIISYGVIILFPEAFMRAFTTDITLITYGAPYLKWYFNCLIFAGVNTVLMYYFQATEKPYYAMMIAACKGFIFIIIGLLILQPILGLHGVYLTTGFSEVMTMFISTLCYYKIYCNLKHKTI